MSLRNAWSYMTPYSDLSDIKKSVLKLVRETKEPMGEAEIFTQLEDDIPAMEVKFSLEFLKKDGWITDISDFGGIRWSLTHAARNHSPS